MFFVEDDSELGDALLGDITLVIRSIQSLLLYLMLFQLLLIRCLSTSSNCAILSSLSMSNTLFLCCIRPANGSTSQKDLVSSPLMMLTLPRVLMVSVAFQSVYHLAFIL